MVTTQQSDFSAGWNRALRLLSRREHAIRELSQKLQSKGLDRETTDEVVEQLLEEGWLNETRFAESFVRDRVRKGQGPYRIRRELQERGVGAGDIAEAMAPFEDGWFDLAVEVKEKKFGTERAEDFRERAKQQRFLQYRGFSHEQISAAVE